MSEHTNLSLEHFQALTDEVRRARVQIYTRQVKAEDEGDMTRANALHAARKTLEEASKEIARAKHDFLFSPGEIDSVLAKLSGVTADIRKQRERLQKAKDVLDAIGKMVSLLNALKGLVA